MVLVNGIAGGQVDASDRGLAFGDGVFRTLRIQDGLPLNWERQYRKLHSDCAAIGINCPESRLFERDFGLITEYDCIAKLIVTRGSGGRGYAFDPEAPPTRLLITRPLPIFPTQYSTFGIRLHLCRLRLSQQSRFAGIKHLNRLENVLARAEWTDPDVAEGLLLDQDGFVVEGVTSNVFFYRDGALHTPDLSRCGVAGIERELILEAAEKRQVEIRVGRFTLEFLLGADEVFVANSVIGIWRVRELAGNTWTPGPFVDNLNGWLAND